MFTSIDKAIAAVLMALIFLANNLLGWNLGLGEDAVNAIAAVMTPLLIWLVPNRGAA
ncbi:MAG: hypothetical protein AB7F08_10190 [Dongiaceae bacterium]